jgi:hypothetical protein
MLIAVAVMAFVGFVVAVELAAAVLPLVVVLVWVPPEERPALAALITAARGSRKLTIWSAIRLVAARRIGSRG